MASLREEDGTITSYEYNGNAGGSSSDPRSNGKGPKDKGNSSDDTTDEPNIYPEQLLKEPEKLKLVKHLFTNLKIHQEEKPVFLALDLPQK